MLQIIDSLNPGGAERVAVTYANLLQKKRFNSFLCCTREEGLLKEDLNAEVKYLFLKKKSATDLKAVLKLKKFIQENEIQLLHAHGTSFFTATIQKMLNRKLKIVWHDHLGDRTNQSNKILIFCSFQFDAIFAVNQDLFKWSSKNLKSKETYLLPNLVSFEEENTAPVDVNGIVCLANLRRPKNHLNLLKSFKMVAETHKAAKLMLIGADYENSYSKKLKQYVKEAELGQQVCFLGKQKNVHQLLQENVIGVLSSDSEGLPMALLEYGKAGLTVIATKVGECEAIIKNYGKIVPPKNPEALAAAILDYLEHPEKRKKDAAAFQEHIKKNYSDEAIFPQILDIYKKMLSLKS